MVPSSSLASFFFCIPASQPPIKNPSAGAQVTPGRAVHDEPGKKLLEEFRAMLSGMHNPKQLEDLCAEVAVSLGAGTMSTENRDALLAAKNSVRSGKLTFISLTCVFRS